MARLSTRAVMPWLKLSSAIPAGSDRRGELASNASWEWRLVAVIVIGFGILAGFFASPIVLGRVGINGDMGMHFMPVRGLYARYLQKGQEFDWSPDLFGGYLLTGEGQHGPYHPLHLIMYRWLPLDVAFSTEVFLPVLILGLGMVVFLRRYVNLAGACLGGGLAAFSINFVVHMQQACITTIIAHIPWMLVAIDSAINATTWRRRQLPLAAIALVTGSQFLLGHPQSTWFSLLTCALFAFYALVTRRKGWESWFTVAAGVLLGLGLGAVQLLATVELLDTTDRVIFNIDELPYPVINYDSFIGVFAPAIVWSHMFPPYFGAVPVILAFWWLTAFRLHPETAAETREGDSSESSGRVWHHRSALHLSVWAALAVALMIALSLGREGFVYRLQMLLPFVGRFRTPARYLMVAQVCAAVLSAVAFARLVHLARSGHQMPRRHLILPWAAVIVSIGLVAWQYSIGRFFAIHYFQGRLSTGPLYFGCAALALTLAARGRPQTRQLGLSLLVLVAVADMAVYCVGNAFIGKIYWRHLPTFEEYLASHQRPPVPPEAVSGRIIHEGNPGDWLKRINPYLLMGYRGADGNAGLYVRRNLDFRSLNAIRVAQTAWYWQPHNDVRRCVGLPTPPEGGWCAVPNPSPRAQLVTNAKYTESPIDDIEGIDVGTTALIARHIELPSSNPGTANVVDDQPGHISLNVQAPAEQLLVLTESHHRGWRVSIDGQPARLEQVNGDFIGYVVSEGEHRVNFDFRCDALRLGKSISLASLFIVVLVSVGLPTALTDGLSRCFVGRRSSSGSTLGTSAANRSVDDTSTQSTN